MFKKWNKYFNKIIDIKYKKNILGYIFWKKRKVKKVRVFDKKLSLFIIDLI